MSDANHEPCDSDTILSLARELGACLRERNWTCAMAESCTGGGISLGVTSIAGSSDYMSGGVVAYSNEAKIHILGVSSDTLSSVGAVSLECAREMALGARAALGADVGISSTGIAGPGGATKRKPVGLVYIAVATPEQVSTRELRLSGPRMAIMRDATVAALTLALEVIGAETPETEH